MLHSFTRFCPTAKASFGVQLLKHLSRSSKLSTATVAALLKAGALNNPPGPHNVTVTGFVRSVRRQKQRAFVALGDGSSYESLQAVIQPEHAHG